MGPSTNDKVRFRAGPHSGARGAVVHIAGGTLTVRLDTTGAAVRVAAADVTNYSLAARKAWKSMPDRAVGRPKGLRTVDRVSVTLRIDRGVWEQFQREEQVGRIADRTKFINAMLRRALADAETNGWLA